MAWTALGLLALAVALGACTVRAYGRAVSVNQQTGVIVLALGSFLAALAATVCGALALAC